MRLVLVHDAVLEGLVWRDADNGPVRRALTGVAALALLIVVAVAISTDQAREAQALAAPTSSKPTQGGGPGFRVCGANSAWHRPTVGEQETRLEQDPRYKGVRFDGSSPEGQAFRSPALVYDGMGGSSRDWLVAVSGVWADPQFRSAMCVSREPQVWLFGYEAVTYVAHPDIGILTARPAPGFQTIVITGPIKPTIWFQSADLKIPLTVPVPP